MAHLAFLGCHCTVNTTSKRISPGKVYNLPKNRFWWENHFFFFFWFFGFRKEIKPFSVKSGIRVHLCDTFFFKNWEKTFTIVQKIWKWRKKVVFGMLLNTKCFKYKIFPRNCFWSEIFLFLVLNGLPN